jgi:glycosyltransferase involved in cell wall biosynthesis
VKVALYHNLPSGGALRLLEEYLRYSKAAHNITVITPSTAASIDPTLLEKSTQVTIPLPEATSLISRYRQFAAIPVLAKRAAEQINEGSFDVAFLHASQVTQAPEPLRQLNVPSLYFAPEYLREVYDKPSNLSGRERIKRVATAPLNLRRRRFDAASIRAASLVSTTSHFTQANLKRIYGVSSEVVYGGVDSTAFKPSKQREAIVLSVGALHPAKGHQFVIAALAHIPKNKRPKLVVVGDRGDYGRHLESLATLADVDLDLRQAIEFTEITALYGRAMIFAAAQYEEPLGLVALEAMSSETPVVAVNEGGLAETVLDARTGFLVERDERAFASAIEHLIDEPDLRLRFGREGRKMMRHWTWQATANRFDELLEQIVA